MSEPANNSRRPKYLGNVVLKVEHYDLERCGSGCYPGLVRGIVMGGPLHGKRVRFALRTTPTNSRTPKIADLATHSRQSATPVGGYIGLNSVRLVKGLYVGAWANRLAAPDAELRVGKPLQISPAVDRERNPRRFRSNGATVYNAYVLHNDQASTCTTLSDLYDALTACFRQHGAALLALVDDSGNSAVRRRTLTLWRGWRQGASLPIDEAVLRHFAEPNHGKFEETIQANGKFDLIPLETATVGPLTAESIDRGMRYNVSIGDYMTGGLGGRLETAMQQSSPSEKSIVERFLLDNLSEAAMASYTRSGWRSVRNEEIKDRFDELGLELPSVPGYGFSSSTAVLRRYGGKNSNGDFFIAKSRAHGPCVPRNALSTPSDPKATSRFYERFRQLVALATERIDERPDAKARHESAKLTIDDLQLSQNTLEPVASGPESGKSDVMEQVFDPKEPD